MGVRGLTTFINGNQTAFMKDHLLHDCKLIIDGNSLCAQLYRMLNCFSAFGGDYDKFYAFVKNFFKNLLKCTIAPYVIFDGGYEARKLKTAYSRLRSKIYGASKLDPVTQSSLQIFPMFFRDVFKEALLDHNIPFTVCEFEADDEIASMAKHLNCPVLSYDSDFYIYNVIYISFNTLETKPRQFEEKGKKFYAFECKVYKVCHLVKYFGGLKEELLPLLATMLGNDYVQKRVFGKFFSHLKLPKSKMMKNDEQRCIKALFQWLQNETLESAVSKIIGRLKKNKKDRVLHLIKKSMTAYNRKDCVSLKYFGITNTEPKSVENTLKLDVISTAENCNENTETSDDESSSSDSETDSENESEPIGDNDPADEANGLPEWLSHKVRRNQLPGSYLNLYNFQLYFCYPQAEDYSEDDAFLPVLPVLRYSFDLLTNFEHECFTYVSREKSCNNYKRISIGKEYSVTRLFKESFNKLSHEQLHQCFHHFLQEKIPKIDLNLLNNLPENYQLYMLAILWWVTHCNVNVAYVHSLFICYIMLEVIDEKTGTYRSLFHFNNKYSKKIEETKRKIVQIQETDELFLNKNKVQYEDSLVAAGALLKNFEIDDSIKKRPKTYDLKKVHYFAQFQCCLQQFNYLNTLCDNPYMGSKYSKCFNGTLTYNIALKLESQGDSFLFVTENILRNSNTVLLFYKSLYSVFDSLVKTMGLILSTTKLPLKPTRRGKRKKAINKDEEEVNLIVKYLESDVLI